MTNEQIEKLEQYIKAIQKNILRMQEVLDEATRNLDCMKYMAPELYMEYQEIKATYPKGITAHEQRVETLQKIKNGDPVTEEALAHTQKVPILKNIGTEFDIIIAGNQPKIGM